MVVAVDWQVIVLFIIFVFTHNYGQQDKVQNYQQGYIVIVQ